MTDTASAASSRLTVALIHGAFADSSGWNDVVEQLQAAGSHVIMISQPQAVTAVIRQAIHGLTP
jgi:alpha-beta hydrolase superfamily lysophospholipase